MEKQSVEKRRCRRILTLILAAVFLLSCRPFPSQAGWEQDKFGWWYREADGTYPTSCWKEIGGEWYYFKDSGYIAAGPYTVGEEQYYFHDTGEMASGEWIEFMDEWYYFREDGTLAKNSWIDEMYYVGKNGAMVKDKRIDGIYIDEDGVAEHPDGTFFD